MENPQSVSFAAFESACTRIERTNKRLFVLCIALLIVLIATNVGWIYYETQYETISYEQEVSQGADGNGSNIFVGGDLYGTDSKDDS